MNVKALIRPRWYNPLFWLSLALLSVVYLLACLAEAVVSAVRFASANASRAFIH